MSPIDWWGILIRKCHFWGVIIQYDNNRDIMGLQQQVWVCTVWMWRMEINEVEFRGKYTDDPNKRTHLLGHILNLLLEVENFLTYESYGTINAEGNQVLLYYGENKFENRKVRNFLDWIKFITMDADKATVFVYSQISNNFTLNNDYLTHFIHQNKMVQFREIYVEVWGYVGQGYICRTWGRCDRVREGINRRSIHTKLGYQNYPTIDDKNYSSKKWSLLTWEDKQKMFKLMKYNNN